MKNDYKLGCLVTNQFSANDVITQTTVLAYILMQHFKRMFLEKDLQKHRLDTLRWRVFNMLGRSAKGGRRKWIKVYSIFLDKLQILSLYDNVKRKTSLLIAPPFLQNSA